jgi:signal transduction histidine kinase
MFFSKKKNLTPKNKLPDKLASLKNAMQPAWVWDPEYRLIVWSNTSGLVFWNVDSRDEIKELIFPENHDMVIICDNHLKKINSGKIIHEAMTLLRRPSASDSMCKLESQILPDGRNGILITITNAQPEYPQNNVNSNIDDITDSQEQELSLSQETPLTLHNNDDIMFSMPATLSCDDKAIIVGMNDIAQDYLNVHNGDACASIFINTKTGHDVVERALHNESTFFAQKLDIGFGLQPYLIQTTSFTHKNIRHFNMGILLITEEKYQEFINQKSNNSDNIASHDTQKTSDISPQELPSVVSEQSKNIVATNIADDSLFFSIIESFSDIKIGLFDVNNQGIIQKVNQTACTLMAYDEKSLIGQNVIYLFGSEAQTVLSDLLFDDTKSILDDLTDGVQCQYEDAHNNSRTVKLIVREKQSKDGFLFIIHDNSEYEKLKSELLELKEKSHTQEMIVSGKPQTIQHLSDTNYIPSFVSAVSHEIRAPLNAIAGYAEMIETEIFGALSDDRYKEFAKSIRGAGEYALSIVNDLLDYSKLKAGGFVPQFSQVNIDDVATQAVSTVYPQAQARNIKINKTIMTGTPHINSDARLLKQILINLLTNAIKYSNDNQEVSLVAGLTKTGRVMIEITDFGRGMTEEEIHKALTPFSSQQYQKDIPGTGLGLSLSKELAELMQTRFLIDSVPHEKTRIRLIYEKTNLIEA